MSKQHEVNPSTNAAEPVVEVQPDTVAVELTRGELVAVIRTMGALDAADAAELAALRKLEIAADALEDYLEGDTVVQHTIEQALVWGAWSLPLAASGYIVEVESARSGDDAWCFVSLIDEIGCNVYRVGLDPERTAKLVELTRRACSSRSTARLFTTALWSTASFMEAADVMGRVDDLMLERRALRTLDESLKRAGL